MTDLEMKKLCAEAMNLSSLDRCDEWGDDQYDPFNDDAQAMALLRHFRLSVLPDWDKDEHFSVFFQDGEEVINKDLSRAIVECVAKMQKVKNEPAKTNRAA